jgi:hypothetical protein
MLAGRYDDGMSELVESELDGNESGDGASSII